MGKKDMDRAVMEAEGTVMKEEIPRPAEQAAPPIKDTGEKSASGFYFYIGPNLKGLLQTGTLFRGTRAEALKAAAAAIEKHPAVKTLIVSGDALPELRRKVRTPGNALYASYQKLAGK